jgi:hypothetical protein
MALKIYWKFCELRTHTGAPEMYLLPHMVLFHVQNGGLERNANILEIWPNRVSLNHHSDA